MYPDVATSSCCRVYFDRFEVPFDDLDAGGVLYNAHYLKYCDRARNNVYNAAGWTWTRMVASKQVLAVVGVQAEYRRAVRLGPLWIATRFDGDSDRFLEASHVFLPGEMTEEQARNHVLDQTRVLNGSWMKMRGVHFRSQFKLAPIAPGDFSPASLDPAFIGAIKS